MKGDFTRSTFRKEKHYRKVNMQQGRVQMDADWNEQNDIQFHYEKTFLKDMIGKSGTLASNPGFQILGNYSFEWAKIGSPSDPGFDGAAVTGLKEFLKNNFELFWIKESTTFSRDGSDKISIAGAGHSVIIERNGTKATLAVDGQSLYEFIIMGGGTTVYSRGFVVGPGNYYIDGILCENEYPVEYTRQKDLPKETLPQASKYLVYLDVWERHITYLDDRYIQEQALGDVDTATRTKVSWQVKLLDAREFDGNRCDVWTALGKIKATTGMMQARAKPSQESTDRCSLYETAGYTRLENQLYTVVVHESGALTPTAGQLKATFKWSRDNGIVVSKIVEFRSGENKIIIQKRGKDSLLDFQKDGWVEVTDDVHDLKGLPGSFVKVKNVEDTALEFDPATLVGEAISEANYPLSFNPKIRRWESKDDKPLIDSSTTKDTEGYIELEEGVEVKFDEGYYRAGDYWFIPARTRTGSVEWPRTGQNPLDEPLSLPPAGIEHHYAPLALIDIGETGLSTVKDINKDDLRSFFSSLKDLITIHYAGGDGQEGLTNQVLPATLRVGVTLGNRPISSTPMSGAVVRFTIVRQSSSSPGSLNPLPAGSSPPSSQFVDATIDLEGIAECEWTLGGGTEVQQVKAELYDGCNNAVGLPPIYFSASVEDSRTGTVATTGIAVLNVPLEGRQYPQTFGPFEHKLDVKVPPAILLGEPYPPKHDADGYIMFTEDYPLPVLFKPFNIGLKYFYIQVWLRNVGSVAGATGTTTTASATDTPTTVGTTPTRATGVDIAMRTSPVTGTEFMRAGGSLDLARVDAGRLLADATAVSGSGVVSTTAPATTAAAAAAAQTPKPRLRWWAIPADDKGEQPGDLVPIPTIEFDKKDPDRYKLRDRITLTVKAVPAQADMEKPDTLTAYFVAANSKIPIPLKETADNTNVYEKIFDLDVQGSRIIVDGNPITIPGLAPGPISAVYPYFQGAFAEAKAQATIAQG